MAGLTARSRSALVSITVAVLLLVVVVFAGIRLAVDVPHLLAGTVPEPHTFEARYVRHPVTAYLHLVPGTLFLLGAPLQLSARFRRRHLQLHRRLGRLLLVLGLLSGVFALLFGARHAFGGPPQAVAAVVFGVWFMLALVLAFRAVRRHDVAAHRRWMIRAFAVGLAVGTIRLWVGLLLLVGVDFRDTFGPAFWLGLSLHVVAAEWWLRARPRARAVAPSGRS